jgi:hypothetical protein
MWREQAVALKATGHTLVSDDERSHAPRVAVGWQQLLGRLGWRVPGGKQYGLGFFASGLGAMTVKHVTKMQKK